MLGREEIINGQKCKYHYSFNTPPKMIIIHFSICLSIPPNNFARKYRNLSFGSALVKMSAIISDVGQNLSSTSLSLTCCRMVIQFYVSRFAATNHALGHGDAGLVVFPYCGWFSLSHPYLSQKVTMGAYYRAGLTSRSVLGFGCGP